MKTLARPLLLAKSSKMSNRYPTRTYDKQYKRISPAYITARWLGICLFAVMLASCVPLGALDIAPSPSPTDQPPGTTPASSGCPSDGSEIITVEDVRCYLAANPGQVQTIDRDTVVLLADPQSTADWLGAAIIYHIPTLSMLVIACEQFRNDYPGLGGVVTLSRIGYSDDGRQALIHMPHECGSANRQAAYYNLSETKNGWQVTNSIAAATNFITLIPEMS